MPSRRDVAEGRTYRPHSQQVPFPPRRSSRRESHRSEAPRSSQPAKKGPKDFNFGRTLGEGSYSTVLAATDRQTHKEYAIKVLDKRHIIKERKVKYVNIERDTLNRLTDHPGIVRLYYTFQDDRSLYFVLDLASGGELLGVLKKTGTFDIECTRFYGAEILDSIAYMHSRGVIHRDLKPENVLLDRGMHVKVTDFGTAKILADPSTADSDGQDENSDRAVSFVGTAEYVSPELLRDKNACKASDLWAFGCIVYQLLVGRPPFKAPNEYLTFQKILALDYSFPDGFPDQAKDLVQRLLVLEPSQRLSLDQIQRHPFFEGIAWGRGLWRQRTPRLKPYAPPPFAPIQLNSGGGAATPAAVKQLRRITELPPPSQLDIDWSPVLTGSNERILKLGNLQVLSAGAAGEAATNTTKLSRFFGGGTAKKRERLVIVTTDARLIIAAAGGNEKKAKAEVNLLAPGTSWSEFIDPKGITAWQLDTKEKHITFDDTRPASSSSDTTREWLDALTQAREMALSTDADQGSNHLQDSSSFSAISSPADSLAVQKQHRKQQLSNGHETAPPEKKKRFSKRHSKSGLAAVF
ncbi:kinase-like protein [Piedraia hortae CBS 480.64]|uniref:non-specific serine/threonine protein kinase n=1 Tax=Piedraia hortae CBS 480.64 TaxID=1314780 RepID=A0A6A7CA94_9PEZI|nr:kinase-like protein [Piedraia hortae CBS 480.64]